jgi:hypothetical protein
MPKPLSRLESLPTELLQKIAAFTPPSAIIALARVSWTIHDATYNAQVLHTHFRGQTWAKKYLLASNVPVGVLARYAVADELTSPDSVGSFVSKQADIDGDLSDALQKALSYLPCLAVLGYEHISVWKENYTTSAWGVDDGLASQKSSIGVFMACCFIRGRCKFLKSMAPFLFYLECDQKVYGSRLLVRCLILERYFHLYCPKFQSWICSLARKYHRSFLTPSRRSGKAGGRRIRRCRGIPQQPGVGYTQRLPPNPSHRHRREHPQPMPPRCR